MLEAINQTPKLGGRLETENKQTGHGFIMGYTIPILLEEGHEVGDMVDVSRICFSVFSGLAVEKTPNMTCLSMLLVASIVKAPLQASPS